MYKFIKIIRFLTVFSLSLILTSVLVSLAQDTEKEQVNKERTYDVPGQITNYTEKHRESREENDPVYEVLGRDLTKREKEEYGHLSEDALRRTVLPREQKLVLVRALLAVGAGEHAREILNIFPLSELKTFRELVDYFTQLKEKHGSVSIGIKTEFVYNIKDSEQAFKNAAQTAYFEVFGIKDEDQDLAKIINFLKSKEAYTYSKMVSAFVESMTPEIKEKLLHKILDELGLSHLKDNKKFIEKILEQKFTYQNLVKLLKQIQTSSKGKKTG